MPNDEVWKHNDTLTEGVRSRLNGPNIQAEMDRLDLMHAIFIKALGQKLFLAPLEEAKVHRALDLGTGTGICETLSRVKSSGTP